MKSQNAPSYPCHWTNGMKTISEPRNAFWTAAALRRFSTDRQKSNFTQRRRNFNRFMKRIKMRPANFLRSIGEEGNGAHLLTRGGISSPTL